MASLFAALTCIGAFLVIPLQPVPVTLQTFFVYLAAAVLGSRYGTFSQLVYIILGLIGLPVFAGGSAGMGVLFGPQGGYLVGFVFGVLVSGKLIELRKKPNVLWLSLSLMVCTLTIYFFGVAQLAVMADLSLTKAIAAGALPFLPGDVLKIAVTILVARKIRTDWREAKGS